MTSTLQIERQGADGSPEPISLKEWKHAVERTEGVRLAQGDATAADSPLVLPNRGGDAEIFRRDCETWLRALFWTPQGTIRFAGPTMAGDPIIELAGTLAGKLNAEVTNAQLVAKD